jgi:hypothetical protein
MEDRIRDVRRGGRGEEGDDARNGRRRARKSDVNPRARCSRHSRRFERYRAHLTATERPRPSAAGRAAERSWEIPPAGALRAVRDARGARRSATVGDETMAAMF